MYFEHLRQTKSSYKNATNKTWTSSINSEWYHRMDMFFTESLENNSNIWPEVTKFLFAYQWPFTICLGLRHNFVSIMFFVTDRTSDKKTEGKNST